MFETFNLSEAEWDKYFDLVGFVRTALGQHMTYLKTNVGIKDCASI